MTTLLVDTAPLVLLVVGTIDLRLIRRHKNTAVYSEDDFRALAGLLSRARRLWLTPHIVAEASSLIRQMGGQNRVALSLGLKELLAGFQEVPIASHKAVLELEYSELGITDAAILCAMDKKTTVLTADADLFGAVRRRGGRATLFRPAAGRY